MAKPWSRYEVGFINHAKFHALSSNAICLWLEGKNHADLHLTDGYLPMATVKGFRFYSPKNLAALLTSAGQKDAHGAEHYRPLWEKHALGIKMHDYLDHNDCADTVKSRIAKADEDRKAAKERTRKWRESQLRAVV